MQMIQIQFLMAHISALNYFRRLNIFLFCPLYLPTSGESISRIH